MLPKAYTVYITFLMSLLPRTNGDSSSASSYLDTRPHAIIGTTPIPLEVVSTKEAIDAGLSHRPFLQASHGMLFLFDHSAKFKFWMKGMRFPLDIIWISEDYKIVDITKNADAVGFFKNIFGKPIFYSPSEVCKYVLEVNANFCDTHSIHVGDSVEFKSLDA
jgi:uncharacterized membrane protein (UPF0127 family)